MTPIYTEGFALKAIARVRIGMDFKAKSVLVWLRTRDGEGNDEDEIQGPLHCPFDYAQGSVEMTCVLGCGSDVAASVKMTCVVRFGWDEVFL